MTLQDLRYLVAISKYLHFRKAAEACCISQPTLSMQLKKMEQSLGVTLVERNHKNIIITPIGKEIACRAQIILDEQKQIFQLAEKFKNPLKRSITLGVFPTFGPYFLPKVIPKLTKKFPFTKIFILEEKTEIITKKLLSGEIDAAFLACPIDLKNIISKEILQEEFLLAVHPSHKLYKRKSIALKDIQKEKLLLLEEGHCLRNQTLEICSFAGAKENTEFRATSLETLRHMVKSKAGITLIPKLALQKNDSDIMYIPFKKPKPQRTIGMFWRDTSVQKDLLEKIQKIIKNNC